MPGKRKRKMDEPFLLYVVYHNVSKMACKQKAIVMSKTSISVPQNFDPSCIIFSFEFVVMIIAVLSFFPAVQGH